MKCPFTAAEMGVTCTNTKCWSNSTRVQGQCLLVHVEKKQLSVNDIAQLLGMTYEEAEIAIEAANRRIKDWLAICSSIEDAPNCEPATDKQVSELSMALPLKEAFPTFGKVEASNLLRSRRLELINLMKFSLQKDEK